MTNYYNSTFKIKPNAKTLKRSGFKIKPRKPLKRTKLHLVGHSTTAELKAEIQELLRQIAIKTYGTCVLSKYSEAGQCGGFDKQGNLILQAEHLNSRSNTATFGDPRNIVLLCKRHHIFWKPQNSALYWELIRKIIGEKRYEWYQKARDDKRPYKVDLKLVKVALIQELNNLLK